MNDEIEFEDDVEINERLIVEAFEDLISSTDDSSLLFGVRFRTFEDASLMTRDKGFEVELLNGNVFQITVQRARQRER